MLGVASQVSRHDQHHRDDNCVRPHDRGEHQRRAINEISPSPFRFHEGYAKLDQPASQANGQTSRVRDTSEEAAKLATR